MTKRLGLAAGCVFVLFMAGALPGQASQLDSDIYLRLRVGMSEGEILIRAGQPDRVIYFDGEAQRTLQSIKQFLYIPKPGDFDPRLTIISLRAGKVTEMERIKIFFPMQEKTGGQGDIALFNRLEIGMSEGELLAIAGPPDTENFLGNSQKQLLYMPEPPQHDAHATVVTTARGKIISLERTKIFSR